MTEATVYIEMAGIHVINLPGKGCKIMSWGGGGGGCHCDIIPKKQDWRHP